MEVVVKDALAASAEDVLASDAIIIGTPENFGYMSGALKVFFENIYYPCLEQTQGLAYGLFIRAGNDGQGALLRSSASLPASPGVNWRLP